MRVCGCVCVCVCVRACVRACACVKSTACMKSTMQPGKCTVQKDHTYVEYCQPVHATVGCMC